MITNLQKQELKDIQLVTIMVGAAGEAVIHKNTV